jgi:hypothetical protein
MDCNGRLILAKQMNRQQGYFTVSLPALSRGIYLVQVKMDTGDESVKIIVK